MTSSASTPCLVTVITVTHNSAPLLEETIMSVLGQSFLLFEYIIVDGGSTDGTMAIIRRYDDALAAWVSEKDRGIYHAMNKGVAMARGKWICFLNSGDVFADGRSIEKTVAAMNDHRDTDIFYGNILVNDSPKGLTERVASDPCNKHRMFFCHQSAFVKTALLLQYPFDEKYRLSADLKFFKQCFRDKFQFLHLNFPVVVYDLSGISNTNRIAGLRENVSVVREMDRGLRKYLFLLRLYFTICWLRLTKAI